MHPGIQKNKILLLTFIFGLLIFLIPSESFAASTLWDSTVGWLLGKVGSAATGALSFVFSGLASILGRLLYIFASLLGGAVLYFGSLVLDYSVYYLVVQMGSFFNSGSWVGQAVTLGWTLIRDLMNMVFIFGLIYIGIKTILDSESAGTRRQLGLLIAAALLINFSLFFTQLLIDFSNILATQMYTQLTSQGTEVSSNPSFTSAFMQASGLSGFLSTWSIQQPSSKGPAIEGGPLFIYSLLLLVFYILAGISFFSGAIMIVTRFVVLIFYMIFSPLMFIGLVLPQFKSYASTWWEGLWKYSIFAPVYLFMLYISLQVLSGLTRGQTVLGSSTANNESILDAITKATQEAQTTTGQIIISFMIMIGLLWASLKIGDKLSIAGSKMAMSGFAAGSSAIYRQSGGRLANWAVTKFDKINENSDGRLTKIGGENVRRALVKAKDYGVLGGMGREAAEKDTKAGMARVKTDQRNTARSAELLKKHDATNYLDHEVVNLAKDPKKSDLVLEAARNGNLNTSAIKAIEKSTEKEDGASPEFVEDLKKAHKQGLKKVLTNGSAAEIKKLIKNNGADPKVIGAAIQDLDGTNHKRQELMDALAESPELARKLEDHVGSKYNDLRTAIANHPTLSRLTRNNRSWN